MTNAKPIPDATQLKVGDHLVRNDGTVSEFVGMIDGRWALRSASLWGRAGIERDWQLVVDEPRPPSPPIGREMAKMLASLVARLVYGTVLAGVLIVISFGLKGYSPSETLQILFGQ